MLRKIIFSLFLVLLCVRPFISSMAAPGANLIHTLFLIPLSLLLLLKKTKSLQRHPLFPWVALFMLAALISLSWSKNFETSLAEFYKYTTACLVFFAVAAFEKKEQDVLIITLLIGAACVSLYALQWLAGGLFHTIDYLHAANIRHGFALDYLSRGRAFVPFTTPSALGGYLILFAPLSLGLLAKDSKSPSFSLKKTARNSAVLLAVILIFLALLSTQSIGTLLSLGTATFISFWLYAKKTKKEKLVLTCLTFLLLGYFLFLRNKTMNEANAPLLSLVNRLSYWRQALIVIKLHPLTGVGLGNYPFFKSVAAHNSFLQIWAETGILGFFALVGIAIESLKAGRLSLDVRKQGLWIASAAFLIHNLMDFTFFQPEVSLFWWVILACLSSKNDRG